LLARADATGSPRVNNERGVPGGNCRGVDQFNDEREGMVARRVGTKVKRNSIGRCRGDMEEVIESVNHQKMHTRYGRIKAIQEMRH
jgi:hypothetical protein